MHELRARDRLIVALDVESVSRASLLVEQLDNVSFFKIGWRLLMASFRTGGLEHLLQDLGRAGKAVFFDLKIPDIGNTVASVVHDLRDSSSVKFLTLHEEMPLEQIRMARQAREDSEGPKLLMVPYLSSQDEGNFSQVAPSAAAQGMTLEQWILARARDALEAGCDGLIASGRAISLFRREWPKSTGIVIVSPGIRPAGSSHDDHKRFTTPAQAIESGADYLVVGRPILNAPDVRKAAQQIIDEIGSMENPRTNSGPGSTESNHVAMPASRDDVR